MHCKRNKNAPTGRQLLAYAIVLAQLHDCKRIIAAAKRLASRDGGMLASHGDSADSTSPESTEEPEEEREQVQGGPAESPEDAEEGCHAQPFLAAGHIVNCDADATFSQRSKLFCFRDGDWEAIGLGEAKLLQHKETAMVRFAFRQEETLEIVASHHVAPLGPHCNLQPNEGSDKCWVWIPYDGSGVPPQTEPLALAFVVIFIGFVVVTVCCY